MEKDNTVVYSVNNSIEIIELFCSGEIKMDEQEEYEIILNRLENIHKQYESYIKLEQNEENKIKVEVLNSFYKNYIEIKEQLELNISEKMAVNLSKNQEMINLLNSLYKKMFVVFDNVEISMDKIFHKTRIIIKQNNKILK